MRIPKADTPGALSVSDGSETVGSIVEIDGSHFAFDVEHVLIGEFRTQREALRAIPKLNRRATASRIKRSK